MGKFVNQVLTGAAILGLVGCEEEKKAAVAEQKKEAVPTKMEYNRIGLAPVSDNRTTYPGFSVDNSFPEVRGQQLEIPKFSLIIREGVDIFHMDARKANETFIGFDSKEYRGAKIYQLSATDYPDSAFIIMNPKSKESQVVLSFQTGGMTEEEITAKYQRVVNRIEAIGRESETPDTMEFTNERKTSYESYLRYQEEMLKGGPER